MTQQNRTWLWLIGCGVGLIGMMTCLVVFAAAALIIIQREESPAPIAEEILVAPDAPAIESVIPDTAPLTVDPALTVNRIVYIDQDGQIVTIAPDGTETRQLTDDDDLRFQFPAWSPDGLQVAAIGSNRQTGGLFVLDDAAAAASVELYRSSSNFPIYLYWSPTGQQVGFLAGHSQDGIGFHLANADGSTTDSLLTTGSPFYWNWLNDGLNLFIHSGLTGEGSRLGFMDNQGNSEATNLAEPGFFQSPGLSADGRYLAYGTLRDNQRRLIIADQQNESEVSVQHQGFVALGWSPTNDQLAFTSPLNPSDLAFGPLRLMDATTGDVTLLDSGPVFSFFWSPNGQAIAYLTLPSESLEDTADEGSKGVLARPQNQPDDFLLELRVVQVATGQRRVLLQFSPTSLFVNQFLPFFDQYALSHHLWSPASDALVLPMLNDDGDPHIMIVRLDGSLPQPLAEGVMAFWSQQ